MTPKRKRRLAELREYEKHTKPLIRERDDDRCVIHHNRAAYCIHHGKGRRGKLLNDKRFAACICLQDHDDYANTKAFAEKFIGKIRKAHPEYDYGEE